MSGYLTPPCKACIDKWGQMPSSWGESLDELQAYDEHLREHRKPVGNGEDTDTWENEGGWSREQE